MTSKVEYDGTDLRMHPAIDDTHKTVRRIVASANAIARVAEAAGDCRPAVLTEIELNLVSAQRRLVDEIVRARLMGRA
jgi:hypothetical protein